MPPQSPQETKKLIAFVSVVAGAVGAILAANVAIRDRTSAFAEGAGTPRRDGLERLAANPNRCAMTMLPSPDNERPMRHVNAGIIGKVDVLELGQSDADHMSGLFFKDDVRFYNGFVSNSYFVYHYEVFSDVMAAHGAPRLVLYDVRAAYILMDGREPEWDTPKEDSVWWGFPPFHLGKAKPPPWYKDIPSLLSLAQTQLTLTWVGHQLPHRAVPADSAETEEDNGDQFRCVAKEKPSRMYRWLADGSRIYAGEVNGVLAPAGQIRLENGAPDRRPNDQRLRGLDYVLGRLQEDGATVIVYSPPLHPVAFEDRLELPSVRAAAARIRAIADRRGVDYCDLTTEADAIGCKPGDFADEHHISRHCNQRVVRELALRCAPRAGAMLKAMLTDDTLR